ncbi:MAG: hypothetical protein ACR2NW_10590, partial [Thermodesulfobacteriota bacterium]
ADILDGAAGGMGTGVGNACSDTKAGYCIVADFTGINQLTTSAGTNYEDYGWEASMSGVYKTGRRDFSIYGDGVIRCTLSSQGTGSPGVFDANRFSIGCD